MTSYELTGLRVDPSVISFDSPSPLCAALLGVDDPIIGPRVC